MARRKRNPETHLLNPTLGPDVCDWIETFLVHGPGDVQGDPIVLDDEFRAFIYRCYELVPRGLPREGRRIYRRAFLSRPKGRSKSELAAMIACAEGLAEVRFDGWDSNGNPVGRPIVSPIIRCFATEEDQAGNTYDNIYYMLMNGDVAEEYEGIDVGLTRTFLTETGGEIKAVTSAAASKDGGKDTFNVFDEAVSVDTPIPTPNGWTTIGDIQVGDQVFGSSGRAVDVVKVTPVQLDRVCYRVTFEDGTSVVASDGHLWYARSITGTKPRVYTTGEMVVDGRRFRVPTPKAQERPEADLPVDPYLLGLWLGDGSSGQPNITAGDEDVNGLVAELESRGVEVHVKPSGHPGVWRIHFSRLTGFHQGTPLGDAFRNLECWRNKHVPKAFMNSSIKQRSELLRGLMDSDGCASGGHCCFVGNERLSTDVLELLRSLGQVATRAWTRDERSRQGGYYRVFFTARNGFMPFSLPRKAKQVKQHSRGPGWVTIKSIEPVESVPVRCIAVDADDHLFLVGESGHVTHNTHLWISPELKKLHSTVTRNLMKRKIADGWSLETSTMYEPGAESVAEQTHKSSRSTPGVLFDHKQASLDTNLKDDEELLEALRYVYGPAAEWMDLEAILASQFRDPQMRESDGRRYWLNQPWGLEEKFVTAIEWDNCEVANRFDTKPDGRLTHEGIEIHPVPDGTKVVLAFDGSLNNDHTVLSIITVDKLPHTDVVKTWEPPENKPADWTIDILDVMETIRIACKKWKVIEIAADPARWDLPLQTLLAEGYPTVAFSQHDAKMSPATKSLHDLITSEPIGITQSGDQRLRTHMLNAVAKGKARPGEPETSYRLVKQAKDSPNKIDLAVTTVMGTARALEFANTPEDYAHVWFASDYREEHQEEVDEIEQPERGQHKIKILTPQDTTVLRTSPEYWVEQARLLLENGHD